MPRLRQFHSESRMETQTPTSQQPMGQTDVTRVEAQLSDFDTRLRRIEKSIEHKTEGVSQLQAQEKDEVSNHHGLDEEVTPRPGQ